MERGSLVGREGWGCKIPISVLLFTSLWNSVGILWQKTSGEQLNLAYPTPVLALKEQNKKHWLGAAPAGFGTHLEHSSVHVRHGSHLIHVPDPKVTHLKNERGHVNNSAKGGGSRWQQMWSSSGNDIEGKLFQPPNHTGQFPSCFLTGRAFTKSVFAWRTHRDPLPTCLWGIFQLFTLYLR